MKFHILINYVTMKNITTSDILARLGLVFFYLAFQVVSLFLIFAIVHSIVKGFLCQITSQF